MNGGSVWQERCEPGWRREGKVPNWFIWLGWESCWLMNVMGGAR